MIIVERAVVAVVKIEADSIEAANDAFDDLRTRVDFTLPKLRFGDVKIKAKRVQTYGVQETARGVRFIGPIPKATK